MRVGQLLGNNFVNDVLKANPKVRIAEKNQSKEAQQMLERAKKYYKDIGQTAIVYDNQTKEEILKYQF